MYVNKYDSNGKFLDMVEQNLFGECESVLDYLIDKRICSVIYDENINKFLVAEECDQYFATPLTSKQFRDLAELFTKISERLDSDIQ